MHSSSFIYIFWKTSAIFVVTTLNLQVKNVLVFRIQQVHYTWVLDTYEAAQLRYFTITGYTPSTRAFIGKISQLQAIPPSPEEHISTHHASQSTSEVFATIAANCVEDVSVEFSSARCRYVSHLRHPFTRWS